MRKFVIRHKKSFPYFSILFGHNISLINWRRRFCFCYSFCTMPRQTACHKVSNLVPNWELCDKLFDLPRTHVRSGEVKSIRIKYFQLLDHLGTAHPPAFVSNSRRYHFVYVHLIHLHFVETVISFITGFLVASRCTRTRSLSMRYFSMREALSQNMTDNPGTFHAVSRQTR